MQAYYIGALCHEVSIMYGATIIRGGVKLTNPRTTKALYHPCQVTMIFCWLSALAPNITLVPYSITNMASPSLAPLHVKLQ